MKKLHTIFFTATLFIVAIAGAQIKKGAIFLGGNISATTEKTQTNGSASSAFSKHNGLTVAPVFGKAVKENLVFGVNASFNYYENNTPSNIYQKQSYYSAGIFLRKYKTIGKNGFAAFIQGDFGGSYQQQKDFNSTNTGDGKRYTIGLSSYPGLSYAISRKLQLETGFFNLVSLNYFTEKSTTTANGFPPLSSKRNGWGLNTNLNNFGSSLYLGFRVLLNKS